MDLIDMKNTGTDDSAVPADGDNKPAYPWGLSLHLDDEVLAKLGLTTLPAVGSRLQLQARVNVTSVGEHESEGSGKDRNVSLQVTALALGDDPDKPSRADVMFGE